MQAEGDDLLDFASGLFEFDLDTADDLANSLDDECSMFLDMDSVDLGLAIDDGSVDDAHLDLGLEEEGDGGSNDSVDHAETQAQDNLIERHLDLEESSSVQDNSELNFEIDEADSNVNEVLRLLEGIEQMPWFDALMN